MKNKDLIREFYEKNKEWIDELAEHGNLLARAMALAIIKNAY
ncbi:MAG: hypothetical protein ACE5K4_10115 [Candidatus Hydrothermarchaeota archaeon]